MGNINMRLLDILGAVFFGAMALGFGMAGHFLASAGGLAGMLGFIMSAIYQDLASRNVPPFVEYEGLNFIWLACLAFAVLSVALFLVAAYRVIA